MTGLGTTRVLPPSFMLFSIREDSDVSPLRSHKSLLPG